jgi:hypothetical protein
MSKKRYYIYFDSYISIDKYTRFLDEFQKNIIIKDDQIVNSNLCYDKTCSKNTLYNISLFAKASNDVYKANIKTSCIKKSLFISKSVKNIILKLCNYSDYYSEYSDKEKEKDKDKRKKKIIRNGSRGHSHLTHSHLTHSHLTSKLLPKLTNSRAQSANIHPITWTTPINPTYKSTLKTSSSTQLNSASSWSKGVRADNSADYNMCLHSDEIIASIKFSYLVVNNITSNLLLFFGFMANCELKDIRNRNLLRNDVDESIILSSYCEGKTLSNLKKYLNIRQVFETFYTIICCYYYYGYCIQDINLGNFIANQDTFYTTITIGDTIFYFPIFQSITIIDYQISTKQKDSIINIKKYINGLRNLISPRVLQDLLKINNGTPIDVLNEFIECECFRKYKVANRSKVDRHTRNIVFKSSYLNHITSLP